MSDDLLNELIDSANYQPPPERDHPSKGWTPGIDTARGEAVLALETPPSDQAAVTDAFRRFLTEWGFDPDEYTIEDDRLEVRTWEVAAKLRDPDTGVEEFTSKRLWYYRARIVRRRRTPDLSDLIAEIRDLPPAEPAPLDGPWTLIVALSDWQLGKRDGTGTRGIVDRVVALDGAVTSRLTELEAAGAPPGRLLIAGMGDLVEGCQGHYPSQTFTVELDHREQENLARRLLLRLLRSWTPHVPAVTVTAVPGNHGERRMGGKAFTTVGDNTDVALFEQVRDVCDENPDRFGHVDWVLPKHEIATVVDVDEIRVGFVHGHMADGRGNAGAPTAAGKVWRWWVDQAHAKTPVGDADVLISAHYHHLAVTHQGPRLHVQAPTLDGGSDWFENRAGYRSRPGTLTLAVGPYGVDFVRVL